MDNKLLGIIVGVVVGIIMLGSVLSPILYSVRGNVGDPINFENEGTVYYKKAVFGDELEYIATKVDGTETVRSYLNGEEIPVNIFSTGKTEVILFSDGEYVRSGGSGNASGLMTAYTLQSAVRASVASYTESLTVKISFDRDEIIATKSVDGAVETSYFTAPYSWAFIPCPDNVATYVSIRSTPAYINSIDGIVCTGEYTTGELDTLYSYYNGNGVAYVDGLTLTVSDTFERVDHTTDVLYGVPTLEVSNGTDTETFVPFNCLVPLDIYGHKDSGAAYNLIGVIPIIVIIAILLLAVGLIRVRY